MSSFQFKGLENLDGTVEFLERTLNHAQENARQGDEPLLRTLVDIIADLRETSTNIRQETEEALRLADERVAGAVGRRMEMQEHVRTLLNRQEVLAGNVKSAEQQRDVYRDQISKFSIDLRIAQQGRDELQRCYNAHDKLLNEQNDELERLRRAYRSLEDHVHASAEEMALKDDKIRDLEQGHEDECRRRMDVEAQLNKAHVELGRWRVAVAHERAMNGGNLRGKSAAAECERLEARYLRGEDSDLEHIHPDEFQRRMEVEAQLKEAQAELWRCVVGSHNRL